jgi:RNA polymerase sigma-70 factor (ECF subfamily)
MTSDSGHKDDERIWAAFEAEVFPHLEGLFRFAVWFEQERDKAEDLVQETLIQALKSFHRFKAGTNCRTWLISILQHERSNRQRASSCLSLVSDPDNRITNTVPFVPPVPQHLTDDQVLAALRRIPSQYQEVVVLCDVEELTYKEIADALAIPVGTVMSRLHRGRELLRCELAQYPQTVRWRSAEG